jgi:hypothetical protein
MAETTTIEIPMTAHDRRRVRRMIDAPDGVRFPLELATGTVLHPGQVLHQGDGRTYVVGAAAEDVIVARPRDLAEAARLGHLIGNLHRDLEADGGDVVALAGDGAFLMTIGDLPTAAEYGANILIVVLNDGAFGQTYMQQTGLYGHTYGTTFHSPNFADIAKACANNATTPTPECKTDDADVPYSVTHGSFRPVYEERRDAMDAAFDRMEAS